MYPVTKAVAEQFKTNAKQNLSLLVNPVVGESFELTSADILSAGLNINRYSATGDSVALGVCSAADLSLRVENGDGRFNDVVFEGAQIYASVGVEDGNNTQWVPLGYFTVDNAPRRLAVISITALDGMVQFDKLANRSALSLPNSVKNIVLACCNECNITIDTDLDALPNSSFVAQSVGDSEDLTYRTILQWCCQVMGVNGYMDWDGHLELSWYKKDGIPETVSGSIATFESVTEVPVSQLIVNIEPYQSFNGYDHPWVGGAGKNLCYGVAGQNNVVVAQCKRGVTYTFSLHNTGNVGFNLKKNLQSGKVVATTGSTVQTSTVSVTFTADEDFGLFLNGYGGGGNAFVDVTSQFQLEVGSTATSWTPYENICPIYPANGKNLIPKFTSGTASDLTFTVNDDGSVHVAGTNTGTAFYAVQFTLNKGDYILSGAPKDGQLTIRNAVGGGAPSAEFSGTFDDYGSEAYFSVSATASAWLNIRTVAGTWDTTYYPMIRHAEVSSPTYVPQDGLGIVRTGKNLLSQNSIFKGVLTDANLAIGNNISTVYRTAIIKLPQGSWTFTFPVNVLLTRLVKDGTYSVISNSNIKTYTINTTTDGWVGLSWRDNTSSSTNWNDSSVTQLEKGSASTVIEPYTAERYYPISDNPVYGGTLDVSTGLLTVTAVFHEFDGTETFSRNGYSGSYFYRYNVANQPIVNNIRTRACSHFENANVTTSSTYIGYFAYTVSGSANGAMQFRHPDYVSATADDFKAWVLAQYNNGTPLQAYAELETPLTYQLTPTQVELLKGTNNIWADGSTLSVTFPAVTEITPADRYNSDIYENAVTITGVSVKGKENQSVVGSEDYALAIDGNPLFTDDDVETIANGLSGLIGFSYHPFSASVLPMPYLYPLDMVAVQYKDEWYDCAITEINFTSTAPTQLKGTGESAQSRSYARINPLTNRERAIIENLKDEMNTTLNKAVNNIIDFNNIISNALGLYHTNVADGSGGFIRYLHDAPDLESSTYIVTETAQGFAWTTNGWNGGTPVWQYGVTSGGYALFKWLSAEGIDVTRASSDYRAEVTPEHFNIYYKSDLIITIDATDRAIQTPRMVIPYSSTSNNSLRVGQLVWLPTPNGANAVVLGS